MAGQPLLALALQNVHTLQSAVDADGLQNMWTVFTKCKTSLENGYRLENISWRLWYRESHRSISQSLPSTYSSSSTSSHSSSPQLGTPPLSSIFDSHSITSTSTLNDSTHQHSEARDPIDIQSSITTQHHDTVTSSAQRKSLGEIILSVRHEEDLHALKEQYEMSQQERISASLHQKDPAAYPDPVQRHVEEERISDYPMLSSEPMQVRTGERIMSVKPKGVRHRKGTPAPKAPIHRHKFFIDTSDDEDDDEWEDEESRKAEHVYLRNDSDEDDEQEAVTPGENPESEQYPFHRIPQHQPRDHLRPVSPSSMTLTDRELHYPTHTVQQQAITHTSETVEAFYPQRPPLPQRRSLLSSLLKQTKIQDDESEKYESCSRNNGTLRRTASAVRYGLNSLATEDNLLFPGAIITQTQKAVPVLATEISCSLANDLVREQAWDTCVPTCRPFSSLADAYPQSRRALHQIQDAQEEAFDRQVVADVAMSFFEIW
ncbi:hypothetical protein BZG36_03867 [Bifiguratus adelaidae]|uniref:Nitrogen regulatory protein areA GATA-like domain-containing protein n=1 Tax=Bifiguratus adelaidae TaxID=1938954 RepID=A0A261XY21_9FUNG|nr:hypothetical protein BZG36_03867 [Bifiguratus adelaidae]